jgi:hypothetical protein
MLILFDPGQVYLFDLGSHHGTHVRKPEEAFSRMLKPESPCLLSGGEFVTLGKSVGRGDDMVRPVVFRVEIHHALSSPLNKLIDLTRSASSERQLSPFFKLKSSGRYGLKDTSSSSSDEMSSSYINDNSSDIEDNAGSATPQDRYPSLLDSTHTASHIGHALELLKGLVPPVHPPVLRRSQSTSREHSPLFVFPPIDMPAWYSSHHRPRLPTSPPFDLPPLIQPSDKTSEISDWNKLYTEGHDDDLIDKSRSNSPMDLASPSPDPSDFNHVSASEPNVVGAWPNSPRASPVPSVSSLYVECGTTAPFVDEASNAPIQMLREESPALVSPQEPMDESNDHPLPDVFGEQEAELASLKVSLDDMKVFTHLIWTGFFCSWIM